MTSISGPSPLFLDEASSTTRPILSFPIDRSPTDEALIKNLLAEIQTQMSTQDKSLADVRAPIPVTKLAKAKSAVPSSNSLKTGSPNSFQEQPTTSYPTPGKLITVPN
jgi:hypothetical protein